MGRMEENVTALSLAVSKSDSLRTTVPMHIAQKLELTKNDLVKWDVDKIDGVWVAIIKKR